MDCIFSTYPEEGEVVTITPGSKLMACVLPDTQEAFVLKINKDSSAIMPQAWDGLGFKIWKTKADNIYTEITSNTEDMDISFEYTPYTRLEYYRQNNDIVIFVFQKGKDGFYVFSGSWETDVPSFAGSPAFIAPNSKYPLLDPRPIAQEVAPLVWRFHLSQLIHYDIDKIDDRNYKGDYCVTEQTLPKDFISHNVLARKAWGLRDQYRHFLEKTSQNWLRTNMNGGFISSPKAEAENVRRQLRDSLSVKPAAKK